MEPRKILTVDDDPFYADLYRTILEPKGFTVLAATDPAAGYEAAVKGRPDLVLLDVMMPEQSGFRDGFDLLEKLKKHDELRRVPVIMISALSSDEDMRHGMDLGASLYMPKHETVPEKLVAAIEKLLAESQTT